MGLLAFGIGGVSSMSHTGFTRGRVRERYVSDTDMLCPKIK